MSRTHSCEWVPPIRHPERFASWSRDVQKLLDYLPRYMAAGRKQRIFAMPWDGRPGSFGASKFYEYYEQYHLEPLILPNQQEAYEQFIQQLPVSPNISFPPVHDYEQYISNLYGKGPDVFMVLDIPGKGRYFLMGIDQGGTEPIPIRGPDGTGEPIVTETEVVFNIDINIDEYGHDFQISLEDLLKPNEFSSSGFWFWKGTYDAHNVAVQAALIRLAYHLPEIAVRSEQEPYEWWEASLLCQKLFGNADLPPDLIDYWGDLYKGETARRMLVHLAQSLPD
ncbi:MAG: hypothetical protein JOZ18_11170 [Chloroflexi bacterium]|nr:hypothetical protein [Chloroflexota bacterium]